jgi:hypothetical protein
MKVSEILANANPQPVSRGRNLYKIGWYDGYLVVTFRGRDTIYIYGIPGGEIPEVERDTLLRVPYPDNLFNNHKTKNDWQCFKVEVKRDGD